MSGGSDLFNTYESEYHNVINSLRRRTSSDIPNSSGEKRKEFINAAKREVEEAKEILEQMDLECRDMPEKDRHSLQHRVRAFWNDLNRQEKRLHQVIADSNREAVTAGAYTSSSHDSANQRDRIFEANQRLDAATDSLDRSLQVANESEQIGQSILSDLHRQRDQISHAHTTLHQADESIDSAAGILRGMRRRMMTNKAITTMIIIVLIAIIGLIIYLAIR
ncbi:hypothetical protein H696_03401 [Fonticula alba]|uniref:t-SNARE coiled-coil homology domain-containing protein n=1 Tax=Fonticula alba TaxID=691883 RepID=A0A058Z757_FONAL|nr:hypothetical protein H696_03401 [Fonticula alba]KCV69936.1 hypothetical protein H696_03401 [Fonticula alba]|eukprot:XP_009495542.1 hypothetical protein H696_03401 [Fonticula alba]